MDTVLSGIRSTGHLHLGNYFGALRNFVKIQDEYKCFFFIADLHSLTTHPHPDDFHASVKTILAEYLAAGLDPEKSAIYIQSDVPEISELYVLLNMIAYVGELERTVTFKEKVRQNPNNVNAGLLTYPVLMASDILIHRAQWVPVGKDQQQHVELTRDLAERFNKRYGETFLMPDVYIAPVGNKILNLQNPLEKMNKSDNGDNKGTIFLMDNIETAKKKIMSAKTDSLGIVHFDEENQPGISNLMSILSKITNESFESIEARYKGKGYGEFKKEVSEVVANLLSEIQTRFKKFNDRNLLDEILSNGAKQAQIVANETLKRATKALGLN